MAALIAAGIRGIDEKMALPPVTYGNAYAGDADRLPTTLRDAREKLANSAFAREAFGDEVIDHYLNAADVEIRQFDSAITDWERVRGFERL